MSNTNKKAGNRTRDQEMAAHLVRIGYPHGRRFSVTNAPCIPNRDDVGSAAYRRRRAR